VRKVEPETLRAMLRAIEARQEVDIVYQSLTNARSRAIAPHSLASDGRRWHVRAWCVGHHEFRDFVLSRMVSTGERRPSDADPTDDMEWNTMVELKVVPHPQLTDAQRSAIERDFGMKQGRLIIPTRAALAFYHIRHLNLDLDRDKIPPQRQQICLANLKEIEEAVVASKAQTQALVSKKAARTT